MANIGTALAGKTLIGAGNGASATFASIGTNSGLTANGVLVAQGNGAFVATSSGALGQVLTSNGAGLDPTYQTPSGGTVTSVSGTLNRITSTGGTTPVIDIDAAYVGQTSITTLGTVSTGTWNATNIALNKGGTNASLVASNGGIFYSTATAGAILSGTATANQVLLSGSSAAPAWSTATYPPTTTINQLLYSSSANTIAGLATANRAVLTTTSGGVPQLTALAADGQLIIGSTAGAPAAATLTAGSGVSITNGSNSITVAALPGASNGYFRVDAGISNVTGDNTIYSIVFDAATFQNGSDISYAAGVFTFNTAGIYHIETFITLEGFNSGVPNGLVFTKGNYSINSGNGPGAGYDNPGVHFNPDSNGNLSYMISGLIQANVNDTFTVDVQVDGGTKVLDIRGNNGGGEQSTYLCYMRIK